MQWKYDSPEDLARYEYRSIWPEVSAEMSNEMPRRPDSICGRRAELCDLRTTSPTYVLGLGNGLMGDDGFGPAVIRAFESEYAVGTNVHVVDLDTSGFDLMPWLADATHVIIVDTAAGDLPPGTLTCRTKSEILKDAPLNRIGPQDPGLNETLLMLEFAGRAPATVTLIGVTPVRVGIGLDLTTAVQAAVPRAVLEVVAALKKAEAPVSHRPHMTVAHTSFVS
jgi:hydrogenase maturation protease